MMTTLNTMTATGALQKKSQQCAGQMIVLMHDGRPSGIMQIGERLGFFFPAQLDMSAPVYRGIDAAISAHNEEIKMTTKAEGVRTIIRSATTATHSTTDAKRVVAACKVLGLSDDEIIEVMHTLDYCHEDGTLTRSAELVRRCW